MFPLPSQSFIYGAAFVVGPIVAVLAVLEAQVRFVLRYGRLPKADEPGGGPARLDGPGRLVLGLVLTAMTAGYCSLTPLPTVAPNSFEVASRWVAVAALVPLLPTAVWIARRGMRPELNYDRIARVVLASGRKPAAADGDPDLLDAREL